MKKWIFFKINHVFVYTSRLRILWLTVRNYFETANAICIVDFIQSRISIFLVIDLVRPYV